MMQSAAIQHDFPIGDSLAQGEFQITERLAGERWRGRFRGIDRTGRSVLITITGRQKVALTRLSRQLALNSPCVSRLRHIGDIVDSSGGSTFHAMIEDEPPGLPVANLTEAPSGTQGLSLAISVGELVARAHREGLALGGLHPKLIYVWINGGNPVVSGMAPRVERFIETASKPNFSLPEIFTTVYEAPEVLFGGKPRSSSSDVFSLSALAAEWISGRYPFEGDNYFSRTIAICSGDCRPLPAPVPFRRFIQAGLDLDPGRRPTIDAWLDQARRLAGEP